MDNVVVLDCEVYPNYFLVAFKNLTTKNSICYEIKGENSYFSTETIQDIKQILCERTTFGFNTLNYDMPILLHAIKGKNCKSIHELSKEIIEGIEQFEESTGELKKIKLPTFKIMERWNLVFPKAIHHFDIIALPPGMFNSLKIYGARLHSQKLQDLPYDPMLNLTENEMKEVKIYCINDLDTTIDLYNKLLPEINLRKDLSNMYKIDLMSKSDAQISEAIIRKEIERINEEKIYRNNYTSNVLKYKSPDYIRFDNTELKSLLNMLEDGFFVVNNKGVKDEYKLISSVSGEWFNLVEGKYCNLSEKEFLNLPNLISDFKIKINNTTYKFGLGGLHSEDTPRAIVPTEDQILVDRDVASYYPSIILNQGLYPKQLGEQFLNVYRKFVQDRLKAKHEGNKIVDKCLKIVINGSFGKLGSKWSILYSPDLMLKVTITGQLALLMLIERLEKENISVISANTDGFVCLFDKHKVSLYQDIVNKWEHETGFITEETLYKSFYGRDVNNYLAVKFDNSYKGKGIFTLDTLNKNPNADISTIAVINYLIFGRPIERTIKEDYKGIKHFLVVRQVKGGAVWRGKYLGRVVRWVYTTDGEPIFYKSETKSGAIPKVAESDGAYPIMELQELPENLDYVRYIDEAKDILTSLSISGFENTRKNESILMKKEETIKTRLEKQKCKKEDLILKKVNKLLKELKILANSSNNYDLNQLIGHIETKGNFLREIEQ